MNLYHFVYLDNEDRQQVEVRAADSLDAFNMFRADHPAVLIADVWVETFGAR